MGRRIFLLLRAAVRRYFVAGVLFFAPIGITIWAIASIVIWLDNLILPRFLQLVIPGLEDPPALPLVGMLFTFFVIIVLGVIARHFFGTEFQRTWERLLSRVPVARSIYAGVKQLLEAIFSNQQGQRFNRVVMIEYPRKNVFAFAFVTGEAGDELQRKTGSRLINCFLPTTPNPTSGFYLLVPEEDIINLNLTVEDAFKIVMSAGLVTPESVNRTSEQPDPAAANETPPS